MECNKYSEKDKTNGVVERIVVETLMCMNHLGNWKSQPKAACKFLNNNATVDEFERFADNLHRLENIITNDIKDIFNKKDSFIFLTLFDKFVQLGIDDEKFAEFLREFQGKLRMIKRNDKELLFDEIDKDASTKDKQVIADKLDMLENMMLDFLHVSKTNSPQSIESFIAENLDVDVETVQSDMDFYNESLNELLDNTVRVDSKLRNEGNRLSLLAMMVYSYKEDKDLDKWLADYAKKNNTYFMDQTRNFIHMKQDFERYFAENRRIA